MRIRRFFVAAALIVAAIPLGLKLGLKPTGAQTPAKQAPAPQQATIGAASNELPNKAGSLKFAAIGDFGDADEVLRYAETILLT